MEFVISDQYEGESREYEGIEPGKHKAICYRIVDGGTAEEGGNYPGIKHKIYVFWELPEQRTADDRPKSIFKAYNLVFGEKSAIAEDFGEWRGEMFKDAERKGGIDILQFLGKGCMLRTGKTAGDRDKVERVLEYDKAFDKEGQLRKLPTHNELEFFNLAAYCNEFSGNSNKDSKAMCDMLDTLPPFVRWRIAGCDEMGKDQIDPCLEVQKAMGKGAPQPIVETPKEEVIKPAEKIEEGFDEDIPF